MDKKSELEFKREFFSILEKDCNEDILTYKELWNKITTLKNENKIAWQYFFSKTNYVINLQHLEEKKEREPQEKKKTNIYEMDNMNKVKKEIREDELRETQIEFTKAQKETFWLTFTLAVILGFGSLVEILSKVYSLPFFGSLVTVLMIIMGWFIWKVLSTIGKNKIIKIVAICLIVGTFAFLTIILIPIGVMELKSQKPQQIQITNIDQIAQNQQEIIKLLNESQNRPIIITQEYNDSQIRKELEELRKYLNLTK